jgi:hypothetical protein
MLTKPLSPLTKPSLSLTPAAIYNIIVLNIGMRAPRSAPDPPRWSACIRQHTSENVIIRACMSFHFSVNSVRVRGEKERGEKEREEERERGKREIYIDG